MTYEFWYVDWDGGGYFTMQERGCWNGMEAWSVWGPVIQANVTISVASKGVTYLADFSVKWWANVYYSPSHLAQPEVRLTKSGAWSCHAYPSEGFYHFCQLP